MDWQQVSAISSCVIALVALIFSIWQGLRQQKHDKLSVRPHLTSWEHNDTEKGLYAVELINNGIGPAIITGFTVMVDGRVISGDGTEPIDKALKIVFPGLSYRSHHAYVANGYSMAAKERCTVLAIQFLGTDLPSGEFVRHSLERGELKVSYKSFYEEKFSMSTQSDKESQT